MTVSQAAGVAVAVAVAFSHPIHPKQPHYVILKTAQISVNRVATTLLDDEDETLSRNRKTKQMHSWLGNSSQLNLGQRRKDLK